MKIATVTKWELLCEDKSGNESEEAHSLENMHEKTKTILIEYWKAYEEATSKLINHFMHSIQVTKNKIIKLRNYRLSEDKKIHKRRDYQLIRKRSYRRICLKM